MSDLPECLQPAVAQLEKYETQIAALESKNHNLDDNLRTLHEEKEALRQKIEEETKAHALALESFEKEKLTLRELNLVVSEQLKEKSQELSALNQSRSDLEEENSRFKTLNSQLSEQNEKVSSESLHVNVQQEALSTEASRLREEVEKLRSENSALKEEVSALTLVNSAMHQRQQSLAQGTEGSVDDSALLAEIDRLKGELNKANSGEGGDISFLKSENERLMQRHGEITQEKMQASAKMHAAQDELVGVKARLDEASKHIEQLEFEHQGLQNLHKNLLEERDALIADNSTLVEDKAKLDEKVQHLSETIQRVSTEKELVEQELNQEHIKADAMTEEVNHLRLKSRTLAEEIKALKQEAQAAAEQDLQPEVQVLEIRDDEEVPGSHDIEIVVPSTNEGPHFPGEFHREEENR